jgi:hypothetical protein
LLPERPVLAAQVVGVWELFMAQPMVLLVLQILAVVVVAAEMQQL